MLRRKKGKRGRGREFNKEGLSDVGAAKTKKRGRGE